MAIAESKRLYDYKDKAFTRIERVPVEVTDTSGIAIIGEVPRCFLGSTFKIYSAASGGIEYQSGIDYVLSQSLLDVQYSKMVEQDCYSGFKFTAQTGIVYVSADIVASYSSGEPINELFETTENHAATLLAHDAQFTAINNKNNEQDLRLSAAETVNNAQNSRLDAAEAFIGAGGVNALSDKAAVANSDLFVIEDSEDSYAKKKVTASQLVIGGGGGDVFGPASSVSDDIALFDGVTGKLLKDSGMQLNTGTTAGTVPVRDANGKIPGCLTIDDLYPVNIGIYTQYPAANSNDDATAFPVSQRPATLFPGTTWEQVFNTEAITFRTEGSPIEDQNDDRTDGLQTDQFQAFQIGAEADTSGARNTWMGATGRNSALTEVVGYGGYTGIQLNQTLFKGAAAQIKPVNNGVAGNPRMGMETRMRNRLWKKWKRIA